MKITFIIFDRMTALDFIGIYDPLLRLKTMGFQPDLTWDIAALTPEVEDDRGLCFTPTAVGEPLHQCDLLVIPGGFGTDELQENPTFIQWLQTVNPAALKVSVCTGALLLGAAGFLQGKRATTHPTAFDRLKPYCQSVVDDRIVDEGEVITARGVTSSIDLGLYVIEKLAGIEVRIQIAKQMDYPYYPGVNSPVA